MTTSRRRALTRDVLVRAAMRTGPGRRYLSEMRYRPQTRLRHGALARTGVCREEQLVGQVLPQPRVLSGPGHELIRLDDVLGPGWSILGMDVTEADWVMAGEASLPEGTRVDVATGDRSARERGGRRAIADADGQLQATVNSLQHRFVLIRPDRVVAAVFPAGKAQQVAGKLAAAGIRDGEQDSDPAGHPDHRQPQTAVA
jgi:3-(3-hydroxy-phenyl)propionate hydroxylase